MTNKEKYIQFKKDMKEYCESLDRLIYRELEVIDWCCDDDMGQGTFYISNVVQFELFYDFKYDPDYPDRDWFVTTIIYKHPTLDCGFREDFKTWEDAEKFVKDIFFGDK